jgi:NAD+ kinase
MLRVDPRNPRAAEMAKAISERVDLDALPEGLCLVFGGDGWMLESIRTVGPERVFLGINAGRLGFLLNDAADIGIIADALTEGAWDTWNFPRLAMSSWPQEPDGTLQHDAAVNDIYLERMTGQTAHLRLQVDGVLLVDRLVCDGIIASTALGSTAYHFSASGHACHPRVSAIHLTPICPHAPRLAPITLPATSVIEVQIIDQDKRPVRVVSDGVDHGPARRVEIKTDSVGVNLAFLEGHDFTATLVRKILMT